MGKRKKPHWFVACEDGTYLCQHCLPASIDPGDDATEVWETGRKDWLSKIRCNVCDVVLGKKGKSHDSE